MGSWWISVFPEKEFLFHSFFSPTLSGLYLVPVSLHLYIYATSSVAICITLPLTYSFSVFPPPIPQITPKHSEHLNNLNTQCTLPCVHSGQRLQFSFVILLSCHFIGFLKVFSRRLEPQEDQSARSVLYTFSKYEPADISYCLKHTYTQYLHTQPDRRTQTDLWESCRVFIAWTSVSMDSCIPFSLLHTSFHRRYHRIPNNTQTSPFGLQCHFIFDIMWSLEKKKNKLICCTETEMSSFCFVFCSVFFCTVPMEWRGTHALSLT